MLPILIVSLAALTVSPVSAQTVAEKDFVKPDAVIKDGLKSVNSVRELVDGSVLVVDSVGQKLLVANWATGKLETRMVGGTGDKEFRALGPLWKWMGDSVAVSDMLKGQLLVLAPDGSVVRTTRFGMAMGGMPPGPGGQMRPSGAPPGTPPAGAPPGGAGAGGGARGGAPGGMPMGAGAGRGVRLPTIRYLIGTAVALGSGPPARPSVPSTALQPPRTLFPILRLSLLRGSIDTVAQLMSAQQPRAPQMSTSVATFSVYVGTSPVQSLDTWTAFADGTVAVIRSTPYHIDLYNLDGTRSQLEPIPTLSIPLSSGDKKRVVDAYKQITADVLKNDPRRTAILAVAYEEPQAWPQNNPSFRGDVVPLVDDQDRIWLQTRCQSDEQAVCYDVISRAGARVERYKLPPKTTVVGFGKGTVFTALEQKSDKSQLQRHAID